MVLSSKILRLVVNFFNIRDGHGSRGDVARPLKLDRCVVAVDVLREPDPVIFLHLK